MRSDQDQAEGSSIAVRGATPLRGHLAGRSLPRQVLALAVWPFFELLMHSMVGLVDTGIAGLLDPASLDAIGVAAYVSWLVMMLHNAVGVGSGALIARAIGGGKRGLANAALGQSILIALVWGAVSAVGIALAAWGIAWLFGMPDATSELVVLYLRVLAIGVVGAAVLVAGNAALRATGDTRTPFLAMVVTNLVNIIASVGLALPTRQVMLFDQIYTIPGADLGVAGIAAGTVLAWFTGMIVVVAVLASGWVRVRLRWRWLRPHWHTARRIIRVGIPSLIENSGFWLGNAIVGGFVGILIKQQGVDGMMGAHIIGIRVESLSFLPGAAIGTAAATLMGQYLGAGQPETARRAVHLCWALAAVIMVGMGVLFMTVPGAFTSLLAPGEDVAAVRAMANPLLRVAGSIQFFFGTYMVLSQALRGAGDTTGPMMITYGSTFLVRLPLAYVLAIPLGYGLTGLWVGLCTELVVRGCLYVWRFKAGKWARIQV